MAAVESARDEVRMPIRLVDGEKAWEADKLAACREEFVPHYFMLLPLAMANGSFEYNLRDITRRVYEFGRDNGFVYYYSKLGSKLKVQVNWK